MPDERLAPAPSRLLFYFFEAAAAVVDLISEFDLKLETTEPAVKLPACDAETTFSVVVPRFEGCFAPSFDCCTLPVVVCCAIRSCSVKLFVLCRIELCLCDCRPS